MRTRPSHRKGLSFERLALCIAMGAFLGVHQFQSVATTLVILVMAVAAAVAMPGL